MRALLIVDVVNDFFPGGALGIEGADKILPVIDSLLEEKWDLVIASTDWHPQGHVSFASTHKKKVGDLIEVDGIEQVLWPDHCIQGTSGCGFVAGFHTEKVDEIIYKGVDLNIDSYSIFFDNRKLRSTGLDKILKEKKIDQLVIVGLATDYCVKYSTKDALDLGFDVTVIPEGCSGIELHPGDVEKTLDQLKKAGAKVMSYLHFLKQQADNNQ